MARDRLIASVVTRVSVLVAASLAVVAIWVGPPGCASQEPRFRLGSLPFPGALSLWDTADPHALGRHVTESELPIDALEEIERGTVYTCKAGFVDVAHLRESADWTRCIHDQVLAAFAKGTRVVAFHDRYDTDYELVLVGPERWDHVKPSQRHAEQERLARLAGQRVAYTVQVWHEIATWYGARTIPFIPEDGSAFTYDDGISHVIGVRLAGEALEAVAQGRAPEFDTAMTAAITAELDRLGAMPADETAAAAQAVKGSWWKDDVCVKRQVSTGIDEGVLNPWIVPGFAPCGAIAAEPQLLTWLAPSERRYTDHGLLELRMRGRYTDERLPASNRPTSHEELAARGGWRTADEVLHANLKIVRESMTSAFGEDFDRP